MTPLTLVSSFLSTHDGTRTVRPPLQAPASRPAPRVLPERHDVLFRDGSTLGLHGVQGQVTLRALREGYTWLVFDLRTLVPEIEDDFARHPPDDHPAIVKYSLRGLYPTALACRHAVQRHAHHRMDAEPADAASAQGAVA